MSRGRYYRKKQKRIQAGHEKIIPEPGMRKTIGIAAGIITGVLLLVYLGTAFFFTAHFYPGTVVNGRELSLKGAEETENYLRELVEKYQLSLVEKDGSSEQIRGSDIGLKIQESPAVKEAFWKQKPFLWPYTLFRAGSIHIPVEVVYDEDRLAEQIASLQIVRQEQTAPVSATPEYSGGEFIVKREEYGTALDMDALNARIKEAVLGVEDQLDLLQSGCYQKPPYTFDSPEVQKACDQMNRFCTAEVSYNLGERVVVDGSIISQWLTVDDTMNVILDENKVKEWVSELAEKYNTAGTTRSLTTPDGKAATVSGGTYGWKLDEEAEAAALIEIVRNRERTEREPVWLEGQTAAAHGAQDWGDTYLEVDITRQRMWYVEDGQVRLDAPVVTGRPSDGRETPEGVYSILELKKDKVLRGSVNPATGRPSYEQPVSYWMRITWTGIGFHDATWQERFGGDWYKSHGSHGCINMRLSDARTLYGMLDYGTPAVVHY